MTNAAAVILNTRVCIFALRIGTSLLLVATLLLLTGCSLSNTETEPKLNYKPVESDIKRRPSAFDTLTADELQSRWAVELLVGQQFGRSLDLYRSITALKRAQFLLPPESKSRRFQVEYSIVQAYFLAGKCNDALQAFEASSLNTATPESFAPFRDLLIMVHACYNGMEEYDKAEKVLNIIKHGDPYLANNIQLGIAIREGDIPSALSLSEGSNKYAPVLDFAEQYNSYYKSPRKAQVLNAIIPGAGYFYTEQKWTALTALVINILFIAAAISFFRRKYYAAALIIFSLELGWYIGGINGGGLAAKEWNEHIYNSMANGMMTRNDLYPFLLLETTF